jgi:hypothetical protein
MTEATRLWTIPMRIEDQGDGSTARHDTEPRCGAGARCVTSLCPFPLSTS